MELCSSNHEEICFTISRCPLCELQSELDSVNAENAELDSIITELRIRKEVTDEDIDL